MASVFANVEVGPKIEVFALTKAYQEDPSMVKVNLSVGGKLFTSFECMSYLIYCMGVNRNSSLIERISSNCAIIFAQSNYRQLYKMCVISVQSIGNVW